MPAEGRPWKRLLASFKAECKAANLPCWICRQPIDYSLTGTDKRAFSADHIHPTSLPGGAEQKLRKAGLKPSHYGCNSARGNTTRGLFPTSRAW